MVTPMRTRARQRCPATGLKSEARTLADEHALLLRGVWRLVEQLLGSLENHLTEEQDVLEALPDTLEDVPCMAHLIAGAKLWPPDEPALILIDALRGEHTVQMRVQRLPRLRPGQPAQIHSSRDDGLPRAQRTREPLTPPAIDPPGSVGRQQSPGMIGAPPSWEN